MEGTKQPIERGMWLALIAMGIAFFVLANDFSAFKNRSAVSNTAKGTG